MVKKKKNLRQHKPTTQNGGDSIEGCDENQPNNAGCDVTSPKNGDRTAVGNFTKETLKTNKETTQASTLPRVRGLCNVGNTCFVNAVLQCLAWTPFLVPVLQEISEMDTKFQLSGQLSKEAELPLLEGELGKWGNLTEILASTLTELQSSKCDVFNPTRLLNELIQLFPQFGGGEQHDSHELLRHLLEGVRTEDLKRYQIAILHLLGLSEKSNPSEVEDNLRTKAKVYESQAPQLMLHPEQVFRGFLVSNLVCQDCLHTSQCVESFLDLSLPVMADKVKIFNKPQPPVTRRKSNNDESFDVCGNTSEVQPSKHQLKKERRQARKKHRRQKDRLAARVQYGSAKENADTNNSVESEQSDAEDNVKQDTASRRHGFDVGESGYSSEKVGNEDSAVESPLPCLLNGDSALASPASPADIGGSMSPVGSGDVAGMSSELMVTIPASPVESVGSPLSPSPVSSEVNIDCSSSVSGHAQMDCASPDCNRPVSRFDFCNEDEMNSGDRVPRISPVDDTSGGTNNFPVLEICEDMSRLCTSCDPVPEPNVNGCEEKQLVCGGDVGGIVDEVELDVSDVASVVHLNGTELDRKMTRKTRSNGAVGDSWVIASEVQSNGDVADSLLSIGVTADEVKPNGDVANVLSNGVIASEVQSNGDVADSFLSIGVTADEMNSNGDVAKVLSNGVIASEVQSTGIMTNEVANWSATVSPRYQCDDGECSIQSCLNQFTALELMTGNNKVGCENCTKQQNKGMEGKMVCTNSTKQLLVKTPPAVLILHLKRFQGHHTKFHKLTRHVSFPPVLDLAPICSAMYKESLMMKPGQNQVLYSLYGVVEHSGTLHGGHYVAYVKVRAPVQDKDPRWTFLPSDQQMPRKMVDEEGGGMAEAPTGKWYFVNDSSVNEVGEERVLRSQAYLLFYERIR